MYAIIPFLCRRLVLLVFTLLAVAVLIFTITQLLPGDVATMILGMNATPEDLETLRRQLGLDQPPVMQFLGWLGGVLHGDFGMSTRFHRPVTDVLAEPLAKSALLAAAGASVAIPTGIVLGLLCALRRNSLFDQVVSGITIFAAAMPEFVTGGLLIVIFSTGLGWLPPFASAAANKPLLEVAAELVLPVASLSLVILAYILRMMRASAIEVLDSEYVKAAILRGLSRPHVILSHVLPIAMGPTLAVIALSIGWLAGGLIIVESLFGYPGIGRLLVFAIQNRDMPLLQAITLVIATVYALANLGADTIHRMLDPRVAAQ